MDAILVLDPTGRPVYVNQTFLDMWSLPIDPRLDPRLVDRIVESLIQPQSFLGRVNSPAGTYDKIGERLFLKDGRILHSVVWPLPLDGSGESQVWNFRDITDRIAEASKARQALEESEVRFRALAENSSDLVTVVALDTTVLYQSPSSERVLGFSSKSLVGARLGDLLHPDDRAGFLRLLDEAIEKAGQVVQRELRIGYPRGNWCHLEISATDRRQTAGIEGIVLNSHDVTARHLLEDELLHQANHDLLTGLLNRRGFMLELESTLFALLNQTEPSGALLLFDVDDFKDINDSLGHKAGDEVLAELGELLRVELGEKATISRLGGDEFSILLRDTAPSRASAIGRRLLTSIRGHTFPTVSGATVDITTSLGLVAFPRDGSTVEELMSRVDLALYEAKAQGRNRANSFAVLSNLEAKAESRLRLRHQIRGALKEDRLMLYEQPILDLQREQVTHHELLLRMKQANGSVMAAKSFIGLAERSGLIIPIDIWVVQNAIALLAAQEEAGGDHIFAINLSAKAFVDRELLAWIEASLQDECPDPGKLIIEVTETAAISDIENAERFIRRLRDLGCRFALDDFGVGFSSLQRLRRLPVDYLKIDGSFIRQITRSIEDRALVQSIVGIARALHMETIAEFVETAEQLRVVDELGVDYAQGNYVGRPRRISAATPGLRVRGLARAA